MAGAAIGAGANVAAYLVDAWLDNRPINWSDLGSAALGGGLAGIAGALAGPLAGTVAKGLGASATGILAKGLTGIFSGLGGAGGQSVQDLLAGRCDPSRIAAAGVFGFGGGLLSRFFPVKGIDTLRQANYFAPKSFSGFFKTGNARALLGAFFTSSAVGAASNLIEGQ